MSWITLYASSAKATAAEVFNSLDNSVFLRTTRCSLSIRPPVPAGDPIPRTAGAGDSRVPDGRPEGNQPAKKISAVEAS
ncbi:hypothetical protein GCM10010195_26140 [Kitasatospora griseola]|nr:hypothetical protein GCM10010195_26140 [Kitasatospora griseola]